MNTKKIIVTTFGLVFFIAFFSAVGIFGQTPAVRGEVAYFGMQTLAAGQSIRLTVVNPKPLVIRELEPCLRVRIVIDVYTANLSEPARLSFARRVERTMLLDAGEAASFDFTAARLGGERFSVSVFTVPVEGTLPETESLTVNTTLEVRLLERTIFTLPGVIKGFNPQPEPPV